MATEDVTAQEAEPGVWVTGPDGELVPDYESTFPDSNEGQVVNVTVVRVDMEEVLVDIGLHTGIMPAPNAVEPIHLSHRIVLNPFVAKRLMDSLRQIVARHEQAFGALELDPQRRLRGGVRGPQG